MKTLYGIFAVILLAGSALAQTPVARTDTVAVPGARCPVTTTIELGIADNFVGPEPAHPSPALTTFLASLHAVGYDVDQPNHAFGDSFRLCACEFCSAKLEIRVKKTTQRDNPANDDIYVGVAPFGTGQRIIDGRIWTNDNPEAPKTLTYTFTPAQLAQFTQLTCHQPTGARSLDVYIEDDTVVDSMKLTITHP
jgi:hypothetical protein